MKVLQINATYLNGSTGSIVRHLQECCQRSGIECHVAYSASRLAESEVPNGYKMGNPLSNKLHALLCRINGCQGYFSRLSSRRLLRHISEIKPDIIHLHNLHSNYINLPMLLRYIAKNDIATVVTLHDCWFFTGGCFHYTNAGCNRWTDRCGHCPKKLQDTPAYLFDRSSKILRDRYRLFAAIPRLTVVGVSNWITEQSGQSVFAYARRMTIHNGIDTNLFAPTPSDFRQRLGLEGKYVVLGPASKWLDPVNSEVLATVSRGLPPDAVLLLFGATGQPANLPANVMTYGFTSNPRELAQLYTSADIFANCSREDSLSTVNLEAQACGLPVVSFDNTGFPDTVCPDSGILVETGDAEAMLKAIVKLRAAGKTDPRPWILDNFDRDGKYNEYIDLFRQIESKA